MCLQPARATRLYWHVKCTPRSEDRVGMFFFSLIFGISFLYHFPLARFLLFDEKLRHRLFIYYYYFFLVTPLRMKEMSFFSYPSSRFFIHCNISSFFSMFFINKRSFFIISFFFFWKMKIRESIACFACPLPSPEGVSLKVHSRCNWGLVTWCWLAFTMALIDCWGVRF